MRERLRSGAMIVAVAGREIAELTAGPVSVMRGGYAGR
jgi:hypothetical protein